MSEDIADDKVVAFGIRLLSALKVLVPLDGINPSTGLFDEIGLDSLQAFEMIVIIEGAAELMVPPPELPVIFTISDAYSYYLMCCRYADEFLDG